ncbi:hypothetical protein [Dickeya poaceiphila]|uniref:Uncharacterized protein n=1 Tax=Dickeya poaceiphila TaxID=568768 RepID=A0A5B8I698_9GAMM|nr:hypothetical protein [Dickeya poaceiphila]QDX29508.1 hypothetical protein Dpoa569_0001283 [Dickeya poaceiphila]
MSQSVETLFPKTRVAAASWHHHCLIMAGECRKMGNIGAAANHLYSAAIARLNFQHFTPSGKEPF